MLKLHGTPWNLKWFFFQVPAQHCWQYLASFGRSHPQRPLEDGPPDVSPFQCLKEFLSNLWGLEVWGIFSGCVGKIIELCLTFFETCEETGYPPGNWHIPPWENNNIVWVVMIPIGWADVRQCLAILLWFDCWNVTFCQAVNTIMAYFESMQFESSYEQRERQLIECKWSKKYQASWTKWVLYIIRIQATCFVF